MTETKEWTLMFYFASDNPLAPSIVSQLKAIKEAGYHPDANVLAQFDPHTVNTPAHIFDVNRVNKLKNPGRSQVGFTANDPYVRNLVLDKLWGEGDEGIRDRIRRFLNKSNGRAGHNEKAENINVRSAVAPADSSEEQNGDEDRNRDTPDDNGRGQTGNHWGDEIDYNPPVPPRQMTGEQNPKDALANFLDFCRHHYPARHYMLFILGHGIVVGNDLFLYDEHAPQHSLSLADLGKVLGKFKNDIEQDDERGQFELIGFHSCSMSALEVAYELRGTANYMLASQGPAFVGSWPYRQILIRVFNDLNPRIKATDLKDAASLATQFKEGTDQVSTYLRQRFDPSTIERLKEHVSNQSPNEELLTTLVEEMNRLARDPELHKLEHFQQLQLSKETELLLDQELAGKNPMRLNRSLLMDAYPKAIAKPIKEMLTKIFYYCLYNSYDFQLAGYSFDLSLCDLNKVRDIEDPLATLSTELKEGLEEKDSDPLIKDLVLLAHWDAQSYWQESYTDLHDFCFCLENRCKIAKPTSEIAISRIVRIRAACRAIMETLATGVIVRSGFAGPAYQYSHGLSIFFPWSEPVGSKMWGEEYGKYKLNEKTCWRDFLTVYFTQTMREPHATEDPNCRPVSDNLDINLLEMLQEITGRVFNSSGQLAKSGPEDRTGKYGPNDPTGADCDCPSIKNYPFITRARDDNWAGKEQLPSRTKVKFPLSPNFFERFSLK